MKNPYALNNYHLANHYFHECVWDLLREAKNDAEWVAMFKQFHMLFKF